MAEGISAEGLTLFDYNQTLDSIQGGMNEIYAADGELINFDSSSPDGQFSNILAQLMSDNKELDREVYNSFNPDNCSGTVQDARYSLNYITRKGGTFTIQNIDITVNKTVTLEGLDGRYNDITAASYTVSDDAGNLWYLIDTAELTAGSYSLPFRSRLTGAFNPLVNTITTQVTKVLGVVSVNNSVAPTSLGQAQETDEQFRIRRNRSTTTRGQNNYDAMNAQLLELDGVTDAIVHVNNTSSTDATGTAAYTVWAIVDGGANDKIATVIYQNGCGLPTRGGVTTTTRNVAGQIITVNFDRVNPVDLYIKFDVKVVDSDFQLNKSNFAQLLAEDLSFNLNAPAETSYITEVAANRLLSFGTGAYILNVEVSYGGICTAEVTSVGLISQITSVSVNPFAFATKVSDATGSYEFSYNGSDWKLNSNTVSLADYGVSYTGTAVNHDKITVTFSEVPAWTDFIASASMKDKFVVDASRIEPFISII